MEDIVKRVHDISRKNNYNLTNPIEQYYRLVTSLVNLEYCSSKDIKLKKHIIGELTFDLIMLCYILDIDFYELCERIDTFIYPIEGIDIIRMGALILSLANNPDNDKHISYLKNHIRLFIEALVTETRYLPESITARSALEDLLDQIERNEKTEPQDETYLNYLQNLGMNN